MLYVINNQTFIFHALLSSVLPQEPTFPAGEVAVNSQVAITVYLCICCRNCNTVCNACNTVSFAMTQNASQCQQSRTPPNSVWILDGHCCRLGCTNTLFVLFSCVCVVFLEWLVWSSSASTTKPNWSISSPKIHEMQPLS